MYDLPKRSEINQLVPNETAHFAVHTFTAGPSEGVERCEINGRKGRRAVCVVAEDKIRYRIFDLDADAASQEVGSDVMPDVE